jgi:hypothetical protein
MERRKEFTGADALIFVYRPLSLSISEWREGRNALFTIAW